MDASGNPLTFGPTVSVTAASFGVQVRNTSNVAFMCNPAYGTKPRPSRTLVQSARGVFMSLSTLGIAVNQTFYGYALSAPDVPTITADWTTYPTTTDSTATLDLFNVMGIYKEPTSVLALPVAFNVDKRQNNAIITYTFSDDAANLVVIERSANGRDFAELAHIPAGPGRSYTYIDNHPTEGTCYYRLKTMEASGKVEYSQIKSIHVDVDECIKIFPMPAHNFVVVRLPSGWEQEKVTASLFTASGTKLLYHDFLATPEEHTISLEGIKPGSYFLQLQNTHTGITETKTLVVIR